VLDVGTGGADIPLALIDRGRAGGRLVRVTAVDSRPEVLEAAALADRRVSATGELALHVADGHALPFPDAAFTVVHSSLVIHHLEPDEARALLVEMARVARHGVVVNDLVRGRAAWAGAWALSHLATRNRYTRRDAPLSVRRAYSVAELTALLAAAGIRVERRFDGPFGHRVALAGRRNGHG
jgi:ubiquinone/menaquinone biosynthesis C-methylase UbiE